MALGIFAQEPQPLHSNQLGFGTSNVLDSYLSPYSYKGVELRFLHEYIRPTKLMDERVVFQSLWDVNVSVLKNKPGNVNEYAGGIRYSAAWMYSLTSASNTTSPVTILAGLQPSAYLGGIYNSRNGNNPAQLKTDLMIDATASVQYNLHLFRKTLPLRYQLTVPLIGMAYSPNYGQSYYEEFMLGNYDHNICFAHIANMPSMRHLLTLDIPIRNKYLRVGWYGAFNQARLNGLKYHSYSNDFILGLSF